MLYYELDPARRELVPRGMVAVGFQIMAAAVSDDQTKLYALGLSEIAAFAIDAASGSHSRIDSAPLLRGRPSALWLSPDGQFLIIGHVQSPFDDAAPPELAVLAVRADGGFAGAPMIATGTLFAQQLRAAPGGRQIQALFCERDALAQYAFDPLTGAVSRGAPDMARTSGGDLAFHPDGTTAYVTAADGLRSLRYDAESGALSLSDVTPFRLPGQQGDQPDLCMGSRVVVHPSGRFVFALVNEGGGALYTFALAGDANRTTCVARESYERFRAPDALAIDRSGHYLLAGGGANVLHLFEVDPQTGTLRFASDVPGAPSGAQVIAVRPF